MFLHFYAFKHHIRGNQSEFFMVRSGLEKYHPRKKEYFWLISESCLTGVFWINYGEPLSKHSSKLKYFPSPLDITQFRNTNDFLLHVVCYEGRACQLLKVSMSQKVEKGPFAALIIENSIKVSRKYFQKVMWPYLLTTKDSLMGKVWGKTFSRYEMLWTAPREIAT